MPRDSAACAENACLSGRHWTHIATQGLLNAGLKRARSPAEPKEDRAFSIFQTEEEEEASSAIPEPRVEEVMRIAVEKNGNDRFLPTAEDLSDVTLPATDHLLLLAQLSRLFPSAQHIEALLRPRSLTVIAGELNGVVFRWAMEKALAPPFRVVDSAAKIRGEHQLMAVDLANCRPDGKQGPHFGLRDMFSTRLPVVLRVLPGEKEPASLALAAAHRVELPNPDRDTVAWMMAVIFAEADPNDLAAALGQLPDDDALSSIALDDLFAALRCPQPGDVVTALQAATGPQPSPNGPGLATLVGYGDANISMLHIVEDLFAWSRGELPWRDLCRGVIFHGPPGVGKTELARAMARERNLGFIATSYADMQKNGHLGDMLHAMDRAFRDAIAARPSILFIDEIDAFGKRRNTGRHGDSYDQKVISGFLQRLDGIDDREGVVVIGACNDPNGLDHAIRRAGRFDEEIYIGPPSVQELPLVLRQHLGSDLEGCDLREIAQNAEGKSGAECSRAVRRARSAARRENRDMTLDDLAGALGAKASVWPPRVLQSIACHEAGHAIAAVALGIGTPVSIRITRSGGICETDRAVQLETRKYLHKLRVVDLAGRAAERMVTGSISMGSGGGEDSDIAVATRRLIDEELSSGMGSNGPLYFGPAASVSVIDLPCDIQALLRRRLVDAEEEATEILRANRSLLSEMTLALFHAKILSGEKLKDLLAQVKIWGTT